MKIRQSLQNDIFGGCENEVFLSFGFGGNDAVPSVTRIEGRTTATILDALPHLHHTNFR